MKEQKPAEDYHLDTRSYLMGWHDAMRLIEARLNQEQQPTKIVKFKCKCGRLMGVKSTHSNNNPLKEKDNKD